MSLPKEELTVYLPADIKAKPAALAAAKGLKQSKWAEFFLIDVVQRKYMEAVSVLQAVRASGFDAESAGGAGTRPGQQAAFPDSAFDPDSQSGMRG